MNKKYRVLFHGLIEDKAVFKTQMKHLGVPSGTVDRIIREAPIILKGGFTLAGARKYADVVQDAGGIVTIQENGYFEESTRIEVSNSFASFKDITMCPECGLKQPKGKICERCGFKFKDEEKGQGRQNTSGH
jgi:hypothetical protein